MNESEGLAGENREALDQNRQFMHELLLRFDKLIERSDRRWERALEANEQRWRATLNRYFGANGEGPAPTSQP